MVDQSTKIKVVKEEFCGACLAIPLAIAGAGVGVAGSKKGDHKKRKKIMLWGGVATALISILVALYFIYSCKDCR
jgi:hypothetical protein